MREENRSLRQQQIETAAYALLEEKGYAGTSMLAIARKARASNETLYNWYGDKQGLFKALVTRNAAEVKSLLEEELAAKENPMATLARFGPKLLELLLGDRAIALNRAAAADPTGELGAVISEAGRETVLPLLVETLEQAKRRGDLSFDHPEETAALYMNLLVGDLQIRRVIGRVPAPSRDFCEKRSALTLRRLSLLLVPEP
ncbi:TetR/AcrR family transcriptional regulator [Roseovarius sp. SK2]|uniref:TetR/AcrR family transcriptional regulator n=1 Tax=Roseovarius TaxID=74030 RepID=UPI00237AFD31|nr:MULTISPECIES: TetR/AcrR family transcriptional regulator [unclassified Roseovarius]MDD9728237.1 TetR/AcrR family transcriptional regulator [Roseovarius sp. SK2]